VLVLSRKSGEQILIGDDIEIVVLAIDGDHVKLGFTAPRYVPIFRAEIHRELSDSLAAHAGPEL
jgi:carbon storage regulator